MKNWINLFEKYRVDRRLMEVHRGKLESLSADSPRRPALEAAFARIARDVHAAERLLAHYGDRADSDRDAIQRADERLFLAYRYIHGLTMEATAEEMCVSRDTVYRIRRRILERGDVPADYLELFCKNTGYDEHELSNFREDPERHTRSYSSLPRSEACKDAGMSDSPADDVTDVLAACFAGAPGGIPTSLCAHRPSDRFFRQNPRERGLQPFPSVL